MLVTANFPSSPIFVNPAMEAYVPPKHRFLLEPHGVTSQETALFLCLGSWQHRIVTWQQAWDLEPFDKNSIKMEILDWSQAAVGQEDKGWRFLNWVPVVQMVQFWWVYIRVCLRSSTECGNHLRIYRYLLGLCTVWFQLQLQPHGTTSEKTSTIDTAVKASHKTAFSALDLSIRLKTMVRQEMPYSVRHRSQGMPDTCRLLVSSRGSPLQVRWP
jgi:hypothetical protein